MTEETPPDVYCEELLVRTIIMFQVFREGSGEWFNRNYVDSKSYYYQLDAKNKDTFTTISMMLGVDPNKIADAFRRRRFPDI